MSDFSAERIDHVAVIITDVERSKAFYGRVLQLREIPRPESFDFPGAWFQIGPTFLHLLGKPQPDPSGPRHFCLWVRNLRAAAKQAEAGGVRVEWKTNHKIPGIDRFFMYDPDDNRIEVQGPELSGLGGAA